MSECWEALVALNIWISYLNFLFFELTEVKNISTFEIILDGNNTQEIFIF